MRLSLGVLPVVHYWDYSRTRLYIANTQKSTP